MNKPKPPLPPATGEQPDDGFLDALEADGFKTFSELAGRPPPPAPSRQRR